MSQSKRRRLARVYRDAAERVLRKQNRYCCTAIGDACDLAVNLRFWWFATDVLRRFFAPEIPAPGVWWSPVEVEPRVQALLLMAEMVEGGIEL